MRALMAQAVLLAVATTSQGAPPSSDPPLPSSDSEAGQAAALAEQLGSPECSVRKSASERLLRLGGVALPAVEAAAQSTDPEVRCRGARLLVLLRQRCFEDRLAKFVSGDKDAEQPIGWPQFCELMGETGASRQVYAEMVRADSALLREAFENFAADEQIAPSDSRKSRLSEMLLRRSMALQSHASGRLQGGEGVLDPVSLALATHFVAVSRHGEVTPRAAQLLTQVARSALTPVARQESELAESSRRLLTEWALVCPSQDLYVLSQLLKLVDELDLREAAPLAVDIAVGKRTVRPAHPQFRATALLIVGKLGDEEQIPRLLPLLEDTEVCASQAGRAAGKAGLMDIEVRDVALAMVWRLSGESPKGHGFRDAAPHEDRLFVLHTLGFRTPSGRLDALEQWRQSPQAAASLQIARGDGPLVR